MLQKRVDELVFRFNHRSEKSDMFPLFLLLLPLKYPCIPHDSLELIFARLHLSLPNTSSGVCCDLHQPWSIGNLVPLFPAVFTILPLTLRIIDLVAESFGQRGLRQPPVLAIGGGQPVGGFPWHRETAIGLAGSRQVLNPPHRCQRPIRHRL